MTATAGTRRFEHDPLRTRKRYGVRQPNAPVASRPAHRTHFVAAYTSITHDLVGQGRGTHRSRRRTPCVRVNKCGWNAATGRRRRPRVSARAATRSARQARVRVMRIGVVDADTVGGAMRLHASPRPARNVARKPGGGSSPEQVSRAAGRRRQCRRRIVRVMPTRYHENSTMPSRRPRSTDLEKRDVNPCKGQTRDAHVRSRQPRHKECGHRGRVRRACATICATHRDRPHTPPEPSRVDAVDERSLERLVDWPAKSP